MPCWFACQRAATVRVTVLTPARASASRTPPFGRRGILCRAGDLRVLRPARPRFRFGLTRAPHESPTSGGYRRIHIRRRGRVLRNSPPPASVRSAIDPNRGRTWHPREFGAVLGGSASLPLPAPPLPSSSRRYAPQCFVGEYTSSPCDVSHRASDEPRCRMSLSSALAPSSLASPSIRRVFLRSFCVRRRPVSSLNLARVSPGAKRSRRRRAQCGVQICRDFVRTIILRRFCRAHRGHPLVIKSAMW